jgi:hypothetical protein
MDKKQFEKIFGNQGIKVSENYVTKSVASNYTIPECFSELIDNILDARYFLNSNVLAYIKYDKEAHTLAFIDDGKGIEDFENLFTLGGTNKEGSTGKIGKFGIGFKGAVAQIGMQCRHNANDGVQVNIESERCGKKTSLAILIDVDGKMIIGNIFTSDCDENLHGTKIVFDNIEVKQMAEVQDFLEETYEFTMKDHGLNIYINDRELGKSGNHKQTLIGDEAVKHLKVGKHKAKVMYRIIGGLSFGKNDIERSFNEAALRVYDETSGRLLAKDNKLWEYYVNKQAQQAICGLRCAIFIDGSIDSYNTFGIKSTKNGVNWRKYFIKPEFKDLSEYLLSIYQAAMGNKVVGNTNTKITDFPSGRTYEVKDKVDLNADGLPYVKIAFDEFVIAKKWKPEDIAKLLDMYITAVNKLEKKKVA